MSDWIKEFDKEFSEPLEEFEEDLGALKSCWSGREIKAFIQKQITKAKIEQLEEDIKDIEENNDDFMIVRDIKNALQEKLNKLKEEV
jgi:hypothetical protein